MQTVFDDDDDDDDGDGDGDGDASKEHHRPRFISCKRLPW